MENLTDSQKSELISQFVEIVVDGMDLKDLVQYVTDDLENFYENKCDDNELKELINNHDNELYNELIENIKQEQKSKILKRCKISIFLGDASVGSDYLQLDDESLFNRYGWLLDNWDESLDSIEC